MVQGSAIGDISVALDMRYLHPVRTTARFSERRPALAAWIGSAPHCLASL